MIQLPLGTVHLYIFNTKATVVLPSRSS
jgi:hypothetical protein